jgi:RNA polymerase sigma-70 factor (ECF subfamily)
MRDPRNDDETLKNTVHLYSASVLRLSFAYLKNRADAEDIAQEVFLAYLLKAPRFDAEPKKRAWLLRVTANKCKNHLRAARKRAAVPLPDTLADSSADTDNIVGCVLALDEKYRISIHLHYYEGYTITEIAQVLHAKPATVGTWLARGRAQLKTMIGDEFE